MATLAHKPSMGLGPGNVTLPSNSSIRDYAPTSSSSTTSHRTGMMGGGHAGSFASPTESEFSETLDGSEFVKSWDEKQVVDWLRSINCGQYEQLFKANNVTGNNLIECDQMALKEMGIKKIGDRVRIFVSIKGLRNQAIGNHKKRNRDSMAALDRRTIYTPSSSGSPKTSSHMRERSQAASANRRWSRQIDQSTLDHNAHGQNGRPSSPLADQDSRTRAHRYGNMSPIESNGRKEPSPGYFSNPTSAKTTSGRRPETPVDAMAKPKTSHRHMHSISDANSVGKIGQGNPHIRVIYSGGQTKVLDIKNCKSADEIILTVLRKLQLPENHVKNYCFYILDGVDPDPQNCRKLSDDELYRVCSDLTRVERNRLILRKIHAGEPNIEELRKAATISLEEQYEIHQHAIANTSTQTRRKLEKLTGESWDAVKYPLSPATFNAPSRALTGLRYDAIPQPSQLQSKVESQVSELKRPERTDSRRAPKPRMKNFLGARPPSELISQELTTYFPDHQKEEIERAVSMSLKRHSRLSKAASRISIASNGSWNSNLKDAPPIPNIADTWLNGPNGPRGPRPLSISRPLSVSRFNLPNTSYRDSIMSTSLQPLQEESPIEPNRQSYVSFGSNSDAAAISVTDPDGRTSSQTYYDSSGPVTEAGDSLDVLSQAMAEDGEGPDEELDSFLKGQSFDEIKWMQGALIGQGSFGSVFLALHAVTGELMAVKQVGVPSNSNSELDKKKQSMVAALKREIDLLRELQHPNIVQYYGSNSDDEHFNIFLEYVPGGSVAAMLNSYGQLQEPLIRNFVRQILAGLSYLHGKDIIHRDIKGANVLVDNKGNIKISDFGISKRVEVSALQPGSKGGHINRPSLQGSVFWMAPEVVKQTSYTLKADIWSLGCLVVEMFTGTHPFPNSSQLQAIFQIGSSSAKPNTPENASEEGQEFLRQTFESDQDKRPSADELLLSPFLKPIC
ncbi:ATP binding [Agyrium rufum]|nr:ATP binding [Agyrium rufum]